MLIGVTYIRARSLSDSLSQSCIIKTLSNMNLVVCRPEIVAGELCTLNKDIYDNIPIPATIVPGFDCGNIRLSYELEIKLGFCIGDTRVSIDDSSLLAELCISIYRPLTSQLAYRLARLF